MRTQKPRFLANMRAATRLLVATRFRGVGGHGNPKTGLLRDLRAIISIPAAPEWYQIRASGVGRKVESSSQQIIRAIFSFLSHSQQSTVNSQQSFRCNRNRYNASFGNNPVFLVGVSKWWVNIKIEQFAIARNAFQRHSLPIWDLSITPTDKQEYLNDPN